ncbi:MAG: hypothetical protein U0003_04965 [Vampirovibrionales bacterium]
MSVFGMNSFGASPFFGLPIGPTGGFNTFGGFGPVNPSFAAFNQLGGIGGFPPSQPFFNAFGPTNNPFPFILGNFSGQPSVNGAVTYPSPLLGALNFFPATFPDSVNTYLAMVGATTPNIAGTGLIPPSLFSNFSSNPFSGMGGPFGFIAGI